MIFAVTGTRTPPAGAGGVIEAEMTRRYDPVTDVLVSGGAVGVDAIAARVWTRLGGVVHTVLPGNRKAVDADWDRFCTTHEALAVGTSYRARNERMVALADAVLGFPLHPEQDGRSRRSGTWMTLRIARRVGKREFWVLLAG